jgi:thiopurine S-methyltransferase
MDPAFWKTRWAEGRTAFHEGKANQYLVRHHDKLATYPRVLVPLCGKSEDLAYLAAQGHDVIGVELVEEAVATFFKEHALKPTIRETSQGLVEYSAFSITIYAGNIFATSRELFGPVDAIYDRAALVALPDDMRRPYVDHMRSLFPKRALVITLEYDQTLMDGPPFSVEEGELRALYDNCSVDLLSEGPDERVRENAPPMTERCFAVTL